jgi:hypothetical protein
MIAALRRLSVTTGGVGSVRNIHLNLELREHSIAHLYQLTFVSTSKKGLSEQVSVIMIGVEDWLGLCRSRMKEVCRELCHIMSGCHGTGWA